MPAAYRHFADIASQVELPADGTFSRTLLDDERLKVVLFGFSAGQVLSEHTASVPAVMHFLQGEAHVTLGDDSIEAKPGTWVHMPAELRHSIEASVPTVMLLLMLKS